jgi:tetratricopeptide (TPR) repeat protein
MTRYLLHLLLTAGLGIAMACNNSNRQMTQLLQQIAISENNYKNSFAPDAKWMFYDSLRRSAVLYTDSAMAIYGIANTLLEMGREDSAILLLNTLMNRLPPAMVEKRKMIMKNLAIACLRLGERKNCIYNHGAESCIFPIAGKGIHINTLGAEQAIQLYEALLQQDSSDLESRWLLNIAYMATGAYPQKVPPAWLLKLPVDDTTRLVKPFIDVAADVGLNIRNLAGGSIIDDF